MDISIVLCTWNNSERLDITLNSFLRLVAPAQILWELVVVNNNSTDVTSEIVSKFSGLLPITYVEEPTQGLSYARNAGLLAASGELILFTDDDVKPCSDWLCIYWQAYQLNPEGCFWGGPIESEFESDNVNYALLQYAPSSVQGFNLGNEVRTLDMKGYFLSANWACPSVALKKIGGFDVDKGLNASSKKLSIGEETDLMDRLKHHGFKPMYLPLAKISHFVPKDKSTLRHIASRSKAWGEYCGDKAPSNMRSGRQVFGAPLWLYRKVTAIFIRFLCTLLRCKIDYKSYLECYRWLGYIEAVRKSGSDKK